MEQKHPMNRGKILIFLMIAVGVAAGTLKIWKQHRHMDQVLANLSSDVVRLIAEAPRAELLRVKFVSNGESSTAQETIEDDGYLYEVVGRKDLIGVKGFPDVRDRLVDDKSYNSWKVLLEPGPSYWQYVLVFRDGDRQARLAFCITDGRRALIKLLDKGPYFAADPISDGLDSFFAAQFADDAVPAQ
jgi:hypothetical protein